MIGRALLLSTFLIIAFALQAQDDDLPAPCSQPRQDTSGLQDKGTPSHFSNRGKIDLSKIIIDPDVTFAIFQAGITVGASPYIGRKVAKNLYVGGGVTYLYTGFRNIGYTDLTGNIHYANASWHTFGGGTFIQYNAWKGFFVRGKFEVMHRIIEDVYNPHEQLNTQTNTYQITLPKIQKTIPDFLIGAGYNLLAYRNFFFPLMISYNVLHSVTDQLYSVYPTGWVFQMGFVSVF